jgi:hypothetical protein
MVVKHRMSLDEFVAWADRPEKREHRCELVAGEIVDMPPADLGHGGFCALFVQAFRDHNRATGRSYVASSNAGMLTVLDPPSRRGPDVAMFAEMPELSRMRAETRNLIPTIVADYRRGEPMRVLTTEEMLTGGTSLPGFTCPLADLFRLEPTKEAP